MYILFYCCLWFIYDAISDIGIIYMEGLRKTEKTSNIRAEDRIKRPLVTCQKHCLLLQISPYHLPLVFYFLFNHSSRRPLIAEVRVRSLACQCGISGGQTDTGAGFSPSTSLFFCQCFSPEVPHSFVNHRR